MHIIHFIWLRILHPECRKTLCEERMFVLNYGEVTWLNFVILNILVSDIFVVSGFCHIFYPFQKDNIELCRLLHEFQVACLLNDCGEYWVYTASWFLIDYLGTVSEPIYNNYATHALKPMNSHVVCRNDCARWPWHKYWLLHWEPSHRSKWTWRNKLLIEKLMIPWE